MPEERMRIEVDKKARAKWMRQNHATVREIAAVLDVSQETVLRWTTPGYNEGSIAFSRAWKKNNRNLCSCGASVRYNKSRCRKCANQARVKWTSANIIEAIRRFEREEERIPSSLEWSGPRRGDYPAVTSVVYIFGSWNKAITAAGFVPRKPGHRRR